MERLPMELLELVLSSTILNIRDVANFSATCHYYRESIKFNNRLWKKKFKNEWPAISDLFGNNPRDYYKEIIYIFNLFKSIERKLELMPSEFGKKYEISEYELEDWTLLVNENRENYWYLVTYLMKIVNCTEKIDSVDVVPLNTPGNKTQQYYAGKVLRHIRQVHLSKEWEIFKSLPPREQLLENGAIFVSQWCQPHLDISRKIISGKLDKIVNAIKRKLRIRHPNHRIFNLPKEVLDEWKSFNIEAQLWTTAEFAQIMQTLREVMFDDMRYKGNSTAYYMPQNSYINEVLDFKQGLPITLAVIFEGVARRVGILCQPINYPSHFLLRYRENGQDWTYVDVYNGGNTLGRLVGNYEENELVGTAAEVVGRIANNLEVSARQHTQVNGRVTRLRSSLELLKLVSPQDLSSLVSLARLYMLHSMDTHALEMFLLSQTFENPDQAQRVVHMLRNYESHPSRNRFEQAGPAEPLRRTPELKFAVGMVMTHLALDYKCVIYDWDKGCKASVDWQEQMHVDLLRYGNKQPFYNVLVEDGSHRYVAQENLQPTYDSGFLYLNEDIGRYFSHHYKTHYVPNANKEREYPYDKEVRLSYHDGPLSEQVKNTVRRVFPPLPPHP